MDDLIFRIKARRESAFLDCDANLARLLADCVEEIEKLEKDNDWLKSKLEKAKRSLNEIAEWVSGPEVNSGFDCPGNAKTAREALKEIEGLG